MTSLLHHELAATIQQERLHEAQAARVARTCIRARRQARIAGVRRALAGFAAPHREVGRQGAPTIFLS